MRHSQQAVPRRVTLGLTVFLISPFAASSAARVRAHPSKPPPAVTEVGLVSPLTAGSVELTAGPQPLSVGQDEHSAFPGLAKTPDGGLALVWRQGTDHVASRDGNIMLSRSDGAGRAFTAPTTIASGEDYRDPSVSFVDGHRWLTYFTGTDTRPAQGAYAQRDPGPPTRIDALPYAAISAPIAALPDGDLAAVYYGRSGAETIDSVWFARSTDGGASWTSTRIANGQSAGRAYQEPWLVVNGRSVHVPHRWGAWDSLGITSSADGGRTWAAPRKILSAATGRPTTVVLSSGAMAMVYRSTTTRAAMLATSTDNGAGWTPTGTLMAAPVGSPLGMTYAAGIEVMPGVAQLVIGMEAADGSSRLNSAYLACVERLI